MVHALVARYVLVALSDGSTPWSRRSHIHPHGFFDVVVASEARLLGVWHLRDHAILVASASALARGVDGSPELRQLLTELPVVLVIHGLVGESLLEDLDQPLFKALQVLSVELVGELLPDLFEPHSEVGAGVF